MAQVPVLRTDEGELLTENPVIPQYVADRHPTSGLAPQGGIQRYRLQQWLNFITSELHKFVYSPLLDSKAPDVTKAYARDKATSRLAYLAAHLDGREFLLDGFTVADAYLITVLNWSRASGIDLSPWPPVLAYVRRMQARPSVAKAVAEEYALYKAEQEERTAA